MRIKSLRIQNFRGFQDETIEFSPYTCFVGPNGAGKSTILCALNVFFRETRDAKTNLLQLQEEDFHLKNTDDPIKITVTFCDLPTEAQEDFKHYYRNNELVVSAVAHFNSESHRADVAQHGSRMVMQEFAPFFEILNARGLVADLRAAYLRIRQDFGDLPPAGTKDGMTTALNSFEAAHPERCRLIESPSEFYGVSRGTNLLEKYVEWIYVPAVKDVSTEQVEAKSNAFGRLVSRAVHAKVDLADNIRQIRESANAQYGGLLDANTSVLNELSMSLQARVARWAHPDARVELMWNRDPESSVSIKDPSLVVRAGESGFLGELSRLGHGLQRSYLLALLQELFESESDGPQMILACEEPELYQHPPQARYLASILVDLSIHDSQVLVSTHSPTFVGGEVFEDVRVVRKAQGSSHATVRQARYENVAQRIALATGRPSQRRQGVAAILHRSLQREINDMFFGDRFVLVEGVEDVAYISSYMHLSGRSEAFRRGGHMLIPVHGKSHMLEPLAVAMEMQLSCFVIFDADGLENREQARQQHASDNLRILRALGIVSPQPFPQEALWLDNCVVWPNKLSDVVEAEIGSELWARSQQIADERWGHAGNLAKNPLHIGSVMHASWEAGARSATLDRLCARILD